MTTPLSAFDCLSRGIGNLRANWQLVPLLAGQQLVVAVLSLLSVVAIFLPLVVFGGWAASLQNLAGLPPELVGEELVLLLVELAGQDLWTLLLVAVVALVPSTLIGVVAMLAFAWLTGGIFGTLLDGEGRAAVGDGDGWQRFRTYRWQTFSDWGGRFMWRYFWYVNAYLVFWLLVVLCFVLLMLVAMWGGEAAGPAFTLVVGCAGLIPAAVLVAVFTLWYLLGLAEMVRQPDDSMGAVAAVGATCRRAFQVLRRRWAAVLLLVGVYLGATIALSLGTSPMGLYSTGVLDADFVAWCGLQTASYLVQIIVTSVVHVAFYGALTALVRDTAAATAAAPEPGMAP